MKYTIAGFSQKHMVDMGMSLKEAMILRWFVDFHGTGKMQHKDVNDERYYWISAKGVLKSMPILTKSHRVVSRLLRDLCDKKVLKREIERNTNGTYSYFTFAENYAILVSNETDKLLGYFENENENDTIGTKSAEGGRHKKCLGVGTKSAEGGRHKKCLGVGTKSADPLTQKVPTYKSINDKSISNESIKDFNKLKSNGEVPKMELLLNNKIIGLDKQSLDLIYDLYDLWEIKKSRLPSHPGETSKITKTLESIINIFNGIRTGTFLSNYPLDKIWCKENKVDITPVSKEYDRWQDFYKLIYKAASRYVNNVPLSKRVGILAFFYNEYGQGGTKCPPYSMFLKYCSETPISDTSVNISKIKQKYSESLSNTCEKFYNNMLAKFDQIFTQRETLRFWQGIEKLDRWLCENGSILDVQNRDGEFKTHFGDLHSFLKTLFNWLENEGGAWGKLFPDIISINGEQWKKFENYSKVRLGVDISEQEGSKIEKLRKIYNIELNRRNEYWKTHRDLEISNKMQELWNNESLDPQAPDVEHYREVATKLIDDMRFTDDLGWEDAWSSRLTSAR